MPRSANADITNGGIAAYAAPVEAAPVHQDRCAGDPADSVGRAHAAADAVGGSTADTSERYGAGVYGEVVCTDAGVLND